MDAVRAADESTIVARLITAGLGTPSARDRLGQCAVHVAAALGRVQVLRHLHTVSFRTFRSFDICAS